MIKQARKRFHGFDSKIVCPYFSDATKMKGIIWTTYVFPGFLKLVLIQLFFPKPQTIFLTCFCRGERRKYARKKVRLNWRSNSQPPGHESDRLTTEPPVRKQ